MCSTDIGELRLSLVRRMSSAVKILSRRDWAEWKSAADDLEQAAKKMKVLKREMGAAVDAAVERRSNRRLMVVGAISSPALSVGLTLLVQAVT
jgi:hypothetical protein